MKLSTREIILCGFIFELTLDKPAPKFIKNDGEKGIEVIKTKLLYFNLSIIFINLFTFGWLAILFLNGLLNTFLTKVNVVKPPKVENIQDNIIPTTEPQNSPNKVVKERTLTVTKTTKGKNANIPSKKIKIQHNKGARTPAFIKNSSNHISKLLNNSINSISITI